MTLEEAWYLYIVAKSGGVYIRWREAAPRFR